MPRRNTTPKKKRGQDLYSKVAKTLSAAQKKAAKRRKQIRHENDLDVIARWRALNRLGITATRKNPSLKNLTPAMKRRINKAFVELQNVGHYAGGRVHRPLEKETYKTKAGKRTRYKIGQYFQATKTKRQLAPDEAANAIKTKKGFIFEKSHPSARVKINAKGVVTETAHGVKWQKKAYRGETILSLYRELKDGDLVLRKGQFLVYKPWGSENMSRPIDDAELFLEMFQQYENEMNDPTFQAWMDVSEIHFAQT
jgi:hypothetical protein